MKRASGDVMNRASIKHDNQQLFQELFDRLKEDGISAFLPQNLSDQHINFLMQSISSLLDEKNAEINLTPAFFVVSSILNYQQCSEKITFTLKEITNYLYAYYRALVFERTNRIDKFSTWCPTIENIFNNAG